MVVNSLRSSYYYLIQRTLTLIPHTQSRPLIWIINKIVLFQYSKVLHIVFTNSLSSGFVTGCRIKSLHDPVIGTCLQPVFAISSRTCASIRPNIATGGCGCRKYCCWEKSCFSIGIKFSSTMMDSTTGGRLQATSLMVDGKLIHIPNEEPIHIPDEDHFLNYPN